MLKNESSMVDFSRAMIRRDVKHFVKWKLNGAFSSYLFGGRRKKLKNGRSMVQFTVILWVFVEKF